ncbi:MAG: hypothetical protein IJ224_01610 [Lachnospiraceae bacterium]|nr:hypothetical protein [Lachnospiraceae bacterium]
MKKLFLYISLLITIFIVSYYIAFAIYNHSKKKPLEEIVLTENVTDDYINEEDMLSFNNYEDNFESVNSFINNNTDSYSSKDKYILGIKDGYVIVYFNDLDTIYEFTDIDVGVLSLLDKEQYEKIKNNISFDSLEDLFDFLESVSS